MVVGGLCGLSGGSPLIDLRSFRAGASVRPAPFTLASFWRVVLLRGSSVGGAVKSTVVSVLRRDKSRRRHRRLAQLRYSVRASKDVCFRLLLSGPS